MPDHGVSSIATPPHDCMNVRSVRLYADRHGPGCPPSREALRRARRSSVRRFRSGGGKPDTTYEKTRMLGMASMIEAIEIKRKMYFEYENAPYHCLDVEVSKPTARGGQTLVRVKMRNLLTRAVFDKTFKAGDRFNEPDLDTIDASYLYKDTSGYYFMDQESFETLTLGPDIVGDDRFLLVDNVVVQVQRYNGSPIGLQFPAHVELRVTSTEAGVRGDTASGSVTKAATLESGLEIRVPLFIKEGEKIKVHTETREFAGRA
jgi:elongation factor P